MIHSWAVPGPSEAPRGRPTVTDSDRRAATRSREPAGQGGPAERVSPQGWRSGKMGSFSPLGSREMPTHA